VAQADDSRHPKSVGGVLQLTGATIGQGGARSTGGEPSATVGGHDQHDAVTLGADASEGPTGEQRFIVGVGVEGDQDEVSGVLPLRHPISLAQPRPSVPSARTVVVGALALVLAVAVLTLLPHLTGTTWATVSTSVKGVPLAGLAALAGVWGAGLWCYTSVLTASLPGLSRPRALLLNLTGSAVSSALPLGGALGVWLNAAMFRTWGFGTRQIADFTLTSNVADVAGKVFVCATLIAAASATGSLPHLAFSVLLAAAGVVGAGVLAVATVFTRRGARLSTLVASRALAATASRVAVLRRSAASQRADTGYGADARAGQWQTALLELRGRAGRGVRARWGSLGAGSVGYVALQGALFVVCLHLSTVGTSSPGPLIVLAAFAVDRLTSMIPLTPSGTGFAEAGASAVLIAAGGAAAPVLAGVLLYRLFVVALEVPVGVAALTGWLLVRRRLFSPGVLSRVAPGGRR